MSKIKTIKIECNSSDDTVKLSQIISSFTAIGDIIILSGDLASGKTHFVKAFAQALKYDNIVTSPTFPLANFYQIPIGQILHMDLYRLNSIYEYHDLGLEEYFETAIVLIEWGEKFIEEFTNYLHIKFHFIPINNDSRIIEISPVGSVWMDRIETLYAKIKKELKCNIP